jgi:predicted DNA-binding ribbon-helix-helix protein
MRTLDLDGTKTSIRLDEATWTAVDLVSERRGMKWAQWAREVLLADPDTDNKTGAVRAAAMQAVMEEVFRQERADQLGEFTTVGFRLAGQCDDEQFAQSMAEAHIEGEADYIGFKVRSGIDEHGCVAFWIENGLRDGAHVVIPTPFKPEQWLDALEDGK